MADDQTPDVDVEQDPDVQAAEAVEAQAHAVVESRRADALARAKHARDLAAVASRVAAEQPPAPVPEVQNQLSEAPVGIPDTASVTPDPVPETAPEAAPVEAPVDPTPSTDPALQPPGPETPPMADAEPPVPEPVAEAAAPAPSLEQVLSALSPEAVQGNPTEATPSLVEAPAPVAAEPEPPPAEPAPEARSARRPFATGRTRPGSKTWRQGAIVQLTDHEWARVRADLTDAEAADGEAGGERLRALVTRYGAEVTRAATRPA